MLALLGALAGGSAGCPDGSRPAALSRPMRFEIEVRPEAPAGQPVPIVLRLSNTRDSALELILQGRPPAYDIVVARRDGAVVWRRLEGKVIPAILQVRTLAAGESLQFRDTWSQKSNTGEPAGPGDYLVTGVLPTDPPASLQTLAVPLRILP